MGNWFEPYEVVFWNVDTQYDFIEPEGKLPVNEGKGATAIRENLRHLTSLAQEYNLTTINTADWHNQASEEIVFEGEPDFDQTFPPHCMQNTRGAEFIGATDPANPVKFDWSVDYDVGERLHDNPREIVLYKDKFNVFEGTPHADPVVEEVNPDVAFVYGVATEVCNDQAIQGLLERDVQVYAVEDAMTGIDPEAAEKTKQQWRDEGVELVDTYEVEDFLEGRGYQARAL
ncbi:MAG: cysteine hydrolase family protein [Nanohaloarchaea archaeon]|nr:cysteine hydrolase family protein [Candidatus Nanohaloarchaea archaeon]